MSDSTGPNGDPPNMQDPDAPWPAPQAPRQNISQQAYLPQQPTHAEPTQLEPTQLEPTQLEPTQLEPTREPKKRAGLIVALTSGGVLLLLLIAGAIGYATQAAAHTPQKVVQSYLNALKHGHASEALRLSGVTPTSAELLLTDKAYRTATNRISQFTLGSSAINGDGAAVTANITQGSLRYSQSFTLAKTGTDLLFFDVWQLRPVSLGQVVVRTAVPAGTALTVAGVPVKASSSQIELAALPGSYPVEAEKNTWYTSAGSSAEVIGFGSAASKPAVVVATLTEKGMGAATAAVNAHIDACAASTDFRPSGCAFGATGEDSTLTYSDQKWTIDTRPVFTIGQWVAGGWAVTTTQPGAATFTATVSTPAGSGTAKAGPVIVRVSGLITKIDDSGATFDSLTRQAPTA